MIYGSICWLYHDYQKNCDFNCFWRHFYSEFTVFFGGLKVVEVDFGDSYLQVQMNRNMAIAVFDWFRDLNHTEYIPHWMDSKLIGNIVLMAYSVSPSSCP